MDSSSTSSTSSSSDSDGLLESFKELKRRQAYIKTEMERIQKEQEDAQRRPRRRPTTKTFIERNREEGAARLMADYFADHPTYGESIFRRRFRMSRNLFLRIVQILEAREPYFQQRQSANGREGFTAIQKCTAAMRQLGNGGSADHYDEYLRMGESTGVATLKRFCRSIVAIFGGNYLRRPNAQDCERLLAMHKGRHGFPGMLGSIDCMHWSWRNCPTAWKGQYTRGDKGHPTIILEAVASFDLWIWHAFFGVAGSNNDINVLNQSDVFTDVVNGAAPPVHFTANGRAYHTGYYLADGIYPKWPVFVQSPNVAADEKIELFKRKQESARKDVERAFGVLKARWGIINGPARLYFRDNLQDVMYACIILHNMIIEDEGEMATQWSPPEDEASGSTSSRVNRGATDSFASYAERSASIRDENVHRHLIADLIEEIWSVAED